MQLAVKTSYEMIFFNQGHIYCMAMAPKNTVAPVAGPLK